MKNTISRTTFIIILVLFLFFVSNVQSEPGADITIQNNGIGVTGGPGSTYLLLRIVGPGGVVVFDESSNNGFVSWTFTGSLPDGQYSYEVRQGFIPKRIRSKEQPGGDVGVKSPIWNGSGEFFIENGDIILSDTDEVSLLDFITQEIKTFLVTVNNFFISPLYADVVYLDDVIITGSECVGFDCVNGESFGFDVIKFKENNLRILFQDTSTGSFPANDWQIVINDTTNGGASYFSIMDVDGQKRPFTIEAGAPAHSLYVEDYGRIGLGTSVPSVELHIADGDTPTVRLDQDGTGGWTAQSWDMAGNETNFFIRDVTNGSKLSFRIQPNTPASTLCLKAPGDGTAIGKVGIGTWNPTKTLHVEGDAYIKGNLELGSSRSLKNNIRSLDTSDAEITLAALVPVRFNYKTSPGEESIGFIAEDVPDLVATKSRKSISTMDVVAVLTKVVQEQQEQQEILIQTAQEQKKTIIRMEKTIKELEQKISRPQ